MHKINSIYVIYFMQIVEINVLHKYILHYSYLCNIITLTNETHQTTGGKHNEKNQNHSSKQKTL